MANLKEILKKAAKEGWSAGHFNFSELDQMKAIAEACAETRAPAILGTSEGERKHLGLKEAVVLRDVLRKEFGIPIFLNADHSKSVASAKEAVDAGYDSVHIDLSAESREKNLEGTKDVVAYARRKNPEISVEGELGYLRGESKIHKKKIAVKPEDYTNPEEAGEFAEKTGVDRLAIAVGNIHGISRDEPALDIERIKKIRRVVPEDAALVLHAGSGIPDGQIKKAIKAGISNIHISTELRAAFIKELKKTLTEEAEEMAMYKLDRAAADAVKKLVKEKLKLFGSENRI